MRSIRINVAFALAALLSLAFGAPALLAQTHIPDPAMPQGETVTNNFDVTSRTYMGEMNGQPWYRYRTNHCFVTSHGIYDEEGYLFSYAQKVWEPTGEITGFWKKQTKNEYQTIVLVRTSDGVIHQIELYRGGGRIGDVRVSTEKTLPSTTSAMGVVTIYGGDDVYAFNNQGTAFVTHDNLSWVVDSTGLGTGYPRAIYLDSGLNAYYASSTGLYTQHQGATSWTRLTTAPQNVSYLYVSHTDDIYAGSYYGLWKSSNHGITWVADSLGMGPTQVISLSQDSSSNFYALTTNYYTGNHLWKRDSATGMWRTIDGGLPGQFLSDPSSPLISVVVDTFGIHVATKFGIFDSYDGGATFQPLQRGIAATNIYAYYKWANGQQIMTTDLGLFTKRVGDTAWTKSLPAMAYLSKIPLFADNNGITYAEGAARLHDRYNNAPNDIYRSMDGGVTWLPDTVGMTQFTNGLLFVDEEGTIHLATNDVPHMRLFIKYRAQDWQGDSSGYSPNDKDGPSAFATDRRGNIYLAVNNYQNGNRFLKRSPNGTWSEVSTSALGGNPYGMTATKDGKLIGGGIGTRIGYYDGNTWTTIPHPAGLTNPSALAFSVDSSNNLYAIEGSIDQNYYYTAYGLYRTSDLGQHWTQVDNGSDNFAAAVSFGDTTYGLNSGQGLIYFTPGAAGVKQSQQNNPAVSVIPNPASNEIEIDIPSLQSGKVEVLDERGNIIRAFSAKPHIFWNIREEDLANGIYLIRITGVSASNGVIAETRRVVVAR